MFVFDNRIVSETLGEFFKILSKRGLNASENMAKNVSKNPGADLVLQQTLIVQLLLEFLKPFFNIIRGDQFLSHRKRILERKICIGFCIY